MMHPTATRTTRAPARRPRTVRTAVARERERRTAGEEEVVGDGGQLKYVSYMTANAATNAGIADRIAEATVMHLKARGVVERSRAGGEVETWTRWCSEVR